MEEGLVTINVCGKLYQSRRSVIEAQPHSMLAMLLRHPIPPEGLFVQRDPKLFRWILYWYSTGILVDETTAGVPKEVWDHELDYYVLFPSEKEEKTADARKRIRNESHELANKATEHLVKLEQAIDEARAERRALYANVLKYMMDNQVLKEGVYTGFDFVGTLNGKTDIAFTDGYPENIRKATPSFLKKNGIEFEEYCKEVGFEAVVKNYHGSTIQRTYKYEPARHARHNGVNHERIHISFRAL